MNRKQIARIALGLVRWARDMTVFVVAFWGITVGGWWLAKASVDALIHEINAAERVGLDARGRKAWDQYCHDVFVARTRQDDLDTANAECSQVVWEADDEHTN